MQVAVPLQASLLCCVQLVCCFVGPDNKGRLSIMLKMLWETAMSAAS